MSDFGHLVGMSTARDVNAVLELANDGIEHLKLVNDSVLAVDDRVRGLVDGGQRPFGKSPASSLNRLIQATRRPPM
jgi:stringent starvation protein B